MGVETPDLLALGQIRPEVTHAPFNMTALAMRLSSFRNAVSRKHGDISRQMWQVLFPGQTPPITSITNGVHVKTWMGLEMRDLVARAVGVDWEQATTLPERWAEFDARTPDDELWAAHQAQQKRLIRAVRDSLRRMFARQGASPPRARRGGRNPGPESVDDRLRAALRAL